MTMEIFTEPPREQWFSLCRRPQLKKDELRKQVQEIIHEVKVKGDEAIKNFSLQFDGCAPTALEVKEEEFKIATELVSVELKQAISIAAENIYKFHAPQLQDELIVETMPGVICSRKSVAIEKAGLYIPGGSAPLFSTILMLAIPAKIAGCEEIILCTPPNRAGEVDGVVLYTAKVCGIKKVFKAGGAQAIAAMAYGTETIPAVNKIFGPGNQYVTCAKQIVSEDSVAIDMPAGPSEVAVYADESSVPAFVAADLLSQAEHGPDSQVMLVTPLLSLAEEIKLQIKEQMAALERHQHIAACLKNSKIILLKNRADAFDFLNSYAPEHLIIASDAADELAEKVKNAGSVFLGNYSAESIGDYASGTNHTLPTYGYAKAYSGVSVDSFVKKITFQKIDFQGFKNIAATVQTLANAEGLSAHANAITIRLNK